MKNRKPIPLVSIVILNWNGIEDTLACLRSVKKISYPNTEVVVVDNGSSDDSVAQLEKFNDIQLIKNGRNEGFTGGHIDGLRQCRGDYIVLLNNDAVIKSDYIARAMEHFQGDLTVGAVGGRAYRWDEDNSPYNETNQYYSYQTINPVTAEAISNQTDDGCVKEVNNVSGSCVVVRRSVIKELGYLYKPFFAYYEETDLFARMKRAGYKVLYDPKLAIWHQNGKSSSNYFQFHQIFKNRFLFAVRNFDRSYLPKFIRSYVKTGFQSTIHRFKNGPNQELHKAFSDAFITSCWSWPSALLSRQKLSRDMRIYGSVSYNKLIVLEESGLSICLDLRNKTRTEIVEQAKTLKVLPTVAFSTQFIVVHNLPEQLAIPGVHCVQDRGYFNSRGINLGWLSAVHSTILPTSDAATINLSAIYDGLWEMYNQQRWIILLAHEPKHQGDTLAYKNYALINRGLLIRYGGFEGAYEKELLSIFLYAKRWDKNRATQWRNLSAPGASPFSGALSITTKNDPSIVARVKRDKDESKKPNVWQQYLERHYRVYQLRNITRWYLSPRIKIRLRLARSKNLMVSILTLNRARFATELKHIRNEYLRLIKYHCIIEEQNEEIKRSLSHIANKNSGLPVFIICRDRLSPLKKLVTWLEKNSFTKITFIDNDSLFPPLIDYYQKTKHQVLRTGKNVGHTSPWASGIIKALCPGEFYIVSDPDVIPCEDCPDNALQYFFKLHAKYFDYQKVGFGLKIDDLPNHFPLKNSVVEWEGQFWKTQLEPGVFEASIDTTFALYKPHTYSYMLHPSIRTGEPYTARHLPWYVNPKEIDPEEQFYRDHANSKITSWSGDNLPERYKKELQGKP